MAIKNLTLPSCFKGLEIFGEKSSLYFINVLLCFQRNLFFSNALPEMESSPRG
jgi:hypothetical protein